MIITICLATVAIIGLIFAYRRNREANAKFAAAQIILQESDDMRDAMMFSVSEATVLADQMTAAMTVTRELDEANAAAMTVSRELAEAKTMIALAKEKARIIADRLSRVTTGNHFLTIASSPASISSIWLLSTNLMFS